MGEAEEIQASCAICGGEGEPHCFCERDRLKIAVDQAERKWRDTNLAGVREAITNLAVTAITSHYSFLSSHRRLTHRRKLASLPYYNSYVQRLPLHPHIIQTIRMQVTALADELQAGLDEDWKDSVRRYPEVLDYYYSHITFNLPGPQTSPPPGIVVSGAGSAGSPVSPTRRRRMSGVGVPVAATPPIVQRPPAPRRHMSSRTPHQTTNGRWGPPRAPSVPEDWMSQAVAAGWVPRP